jgi:hypothetical protein
LHGKKNKQYHKAVSGGSKRARTMASFIPQQSGGSTINNNNNGGFAFQPPPGTHSTMFLDGHQHHQQQQQQQQGENCRRCGTVGCDVKVLDCGCLFHAVSLFGFDFFLSFFVLGYFLNSFNV